MTCSLWWPIFAASVFLCLNLNRRCTRCSHWPGDIRGDSPLLPSHLDRPWWPGGEVPRGVHDFVRTPTTGIPATNNAKNRLYRHYFNHSENCSAPPCVGVGGMLALMCPDPLFLRLMGKLRSNFYFQPPVCVGLSPFGCLMTLSSDTGRRNKNTQLLD